MMENRRVMMLGRLTVRRWRPERLGPSFPMCDLTKFHGAGVLVERKSVCRERQEENRSP